MKKVLFAMASIAMMVSMMGCEPREKGPSQQEILTNIMGTWKLSAKDGKECPTDEKFVITYNNDGTRLSSASMYFSTIDKYVWSVKQLGYYFVSDNELVEYNKQNSVHFAVNRINGQEMVLTENKAIMDGKEYLLNEKQTYTKCQSVTDYSTAIIGVWKGIEMTGDSTHGDANHRWEYKTDGTYTYYSYDEQAGWVPSDNKMNEYNIHGDWLATRWTESNDVTNYEWWDVACITADTMKWEALRKNNDGTTFRTTFTLARIKD